jgi:hypothetical protein
MARLRKSIPSQLILLLTPSSHIMACSRRHHIGVPGAPVFLVFCTAVIHRGGAADREVQRFWREDVTGAEKPVALHAREKVQEPNSQQRKASKKGPLAGWRLLAKDSFSWWSLAFRSLEFACSTPEGLMQAAGRSLEAALPGVDFSPVLA